MYVQANRRGGGEYGVSWQQAGRKEKKQNVFDDFVAVAEWLIANGYTRSGRLAIQGGSNGGLLVGAIMTQRPELARVALPAVGVMDMLRFHTFTIGWNWIADYGSRDDAEGFLYLYAYSPLHYLRYGVDYPATLVSTADHDDRVVGSPRALPGQDHVDPFARPWDLAFHADPEIVRQQGIAQDVADVLKGVPPATHLGRGHTAAESIPEAVDQQLIDPGILQIPQEGQLGGLVNDHGANSVYFLTDPLDFSTGYFPAFRAIFSETISVTFHP